MDSTTAVMRSDLAYLDRFHHWDSEEKREIWKESTVGGTAAPRWAEWWHRLAFGYRHGYRPQRHGTLMSFERNYLNPYFRGEISVAMMGVIIREAEALDKENGIS